ncbi:hypothetical protein BGZ49_009146, partial [Haplosporangium sp. Z 27]
MDVTHLSRLTPFTGMIQTRESSFRAVLRSKINLNGAEDSSSTAKNENQFLNSDAFQMHT